MSNTVQYILVDEKAMVPKKHHASDVGFDLTAIREDKRLSKYTVRYDTGIIVRPPLGYYTEIIPRSSIVKTGHVLANSIGIIDPDYTGTLKIVLTKVDDAPEVELKLPFTVCQLVLRKREDFVMQETKSCEETVRGSGGFGSTDTK